MVFITSGTESNIEVASSGVYYEENQRKNTRMINQRDTKLNTSIMIMKQIRFRLASGSLRLCFLNRICFFKRLGGENSTRKKNLKNKQVKRVAFIVRMDERGNYRKNEHTKMLKALTRFLAYDRRS